MVLILVYTSWDGNEWQPSGPMIYKSKNLLISETNKIKKWIERLK